MARGAVRGKGYATITASSRGSTWVSPPVSSNTRMADEMVRVTYRVGVRVGVRVRVRGRNRVSVGVRADRGAACRAPPPRRCHPPG